MARLFPATLDGAGATRLQSRVVSRLRDALDDDHWIWFRPSLRHGNHGYRPHLIVLGPGYGALVLYIEPWTAAEIVRGTAESLFVRVKETGVVPREHPEAEARTAAEALRARLNAARSRGSVGSDGGSEPGDAIPVSSGVVLPGLSRADVARLGTRDIPLDADRLLVKEDLASAEGIRAGLARLGTRVRGGLSDRMRERMRAVIEPQLHFLDLRGEVEEPVPAPETPPDKTPALEVPATETAETAETVVPETAAPRAPTGEPGPSDASPRTAPGFWLDQKQERMARELASPRALVYGPAGSGKTVFLVSRAQYWVDRSPGTRVLFTCYNASLASHIRQVFGSRDMEPDGERLTVRHYHDLCGFILGMTDIHNRSPEFYAALEPKVLREMSARDDVPAYDLILVDEGQDFTRRMIEVLVRLCADGGEITLVCDPAQDIYGRWSTDTLAPFREHDTEHLVDVYRNTAPIFSLARAVLTPEMRKEMGLTRLEMTRPEDLGRTGPPPELVTLPDLDALADAIVEQVQIFRREGRPLSDLAVLYPDRGAIARFGDLLGRSKWQTARDPRFREPDDEDALPEPDVVLGTLHPQSDRDDAPPSSRPHFAEALEQELLHRGVPVEWAARDYDSKARFDISKDRLTLSTVHSAKGMDFHTVILLGVDTLPYREGKAGHRARSLLFTGITRARERLVMLVFGDGGWVPELRERLTDIE